MSKAEQMMPSKSKKESPFPVGRSKKGIKYSTKKRSAVGESNNERRALEKKLGGKTLRMK